MADMPVFASPRLSRRATIPLREPAGAFDDGLMPLNETEPVSAPARRALAHWHAMCGDAPVPYRHALDPVDIPDLLPNSELIEVLDRARDFRYRLIGDVIDRISRDCRAGRRLSEIPSQRPPSLIFSLYAETVRRAHPVCVRLPYAGDDPFVDHVEALITPLTEDGSGIGMLWGVVVPIQIETAVR